MLDHHGEIVRCAIGKEADPGLVGIHLINQVHIQKGDMHVVRQGAVEDRAVLEAVPEVVTNLVMNAVQAMSTPGEVVVTVERSERSPPPDLGGHPREFVVIRVRDQGPGIAPEHLPHVFEPFFTTKDVGEGTGLGLSVAYGMVREHGGFLDVASTPGQGATFSVHLPASAS